MKNLNEAELIKINGGNALLKYAVEIAFAAVAIAYEVGFNAGQAQGAKDRSQGLPHKDWDAAVIITEESLGLE